MNADPLQAAWQSQPPPGRLTINTDLLLQEVRRNQRTFTSQVYWRDAREIGIALVLIPVWIYLGRVVGEFWTWYLTIPALVWVVAFMIIDRRRHQRPQPSPGDPLRDSIQRSLADVEHQIYLLRNIFWWYILPFIPPILAFIIQISWIAHPNIQLMGFIFLTFSGYIGLTLFLIYRINQHAVRTTLESRRQELAALLSSLHDDASGGDAQSTANTEIG